MNAETVETALAREGIYCVPGQNDLDAGVAQLLTRMQHGRLKVSEACRYTRDAADDYVAEDRGDGVFKPVKTGQEHTLDGLRYCAMQRPYDAFLEETAPERRLGWVPGEAPPAHWLKPRADSAPMGAMS